MAIRIGKKTKLEFKLIYHLKTPLCDPPVMESLGIKIINTYPRRKSQTWGKYVLSPKDVTENEVKSVNKILGILNTEGDCK